MYASSRHRAPNGSGAYPSSRSPPLRSPSLSPYTTADLHSARLHHRIQICDAPVLLSATHSTFVEVLGDVTEFDSIRMSDWRAFGDNLGACLLALGQAGLGHCRVRLAWRSKRARQSVIFHAFIKPTGEPLVHTHQPEPQRHTLGHQQRAARLAAQLASGLSLRARGQSAGCGCSRAI